MTTPTAAHPENSPDEQVEEVDPAGNVIRLVSRREMRAGALRHRSVFIAVISEEGDLLVHQRAATKDVWPEWWDIAVGGVCQPGEEWHHAAARELSEELGLEHATVEELGGGAYVDAEVKLLARIFLCRTDGPFRFADGEITQAHWVSAAEFPNWLGAKNFLPDSLALVLPLLRGFATITP